MTAEADREDQAQRGVPDAGKPSFVCPYADCATYALQPSGGILWELETVGSHSWIEGWTANRCHACRRPIFWVNNGSGMVMAYPMGAVGEPPADDMPTAARDVYEEARLVARVSKRSAAALLRLVLQMIVDHLEPGSGDINTKIGRLVQKGLHPQIQQAMDVLRVVGNHAVHPGQINVDDDPALLPGLFRLINVVVDQMVSVPKHAQSLYNSLPQAARDQVGRRDATTSSAP
ncbi:DUF4145 domain-containing protein [Dactylosporangium sp. NPDC051541]|uniref:DUF4145 domain-containing protein n=1 Tax=Dactylosporangium sp. NPDC051541 TaxID=3363977 RepID=UPI00378F67CE